MPCWVTQAASDKTWGGDAPALAPPSLMESTSLRWRAGGHRGMESGSPTPPPRCTLESEQVGASALPPGGTPGFPSALYPRPHPQSALGGRIQILSNG